MNYRIEKDTLGEVKVPSDKYWGAQTQRSFENFKIGIEKMPMEVIYAFAILKKASAIANNKLNKLDEKRKDLIIQVCDEIIDGKLDEHFPLAVWQTGSGTQSNMNMNEVIANRANEITNESLIHPNDHVNMSQSSNDTFPTAMSIASTISIEDKLIPSIDSLILTLNKLEHENKDVIKTGRTHLQDAVPLSLGQEISAWRKMLEVNLKNINLAKENLTYLALGGTAVGTGLNAPNGFDLLVAREISNLTKKHFKTSENKFFSLTSKSDYTYVHGSMKSLAVDLMKIANDIRWLASGPRCGIGELIIPANEPGSSIMPGKVNPTQAEAITMVVGQILGNDVAISFGASQGNFQLNVFMPLIIYNFLQSVNILSDGINSFNKNCVVGIKPNIDKINENLEKSLMLVTALNPYIGYEKSAEIAKTAHKNNTTLKEEAVNLGYLTSEEFDKIIVPKNMV